MNLGPRVSKWSCETEVEDIECFLIICFQDFVPRIQQRLRSRWCQLKRSIVIISYNYLWVLFMYLRHAEESQKDEAMQNRYVSIIKNKAIIDSYLCTITYKSSSFRIQDYKSLQQTLYTQSTQYIVRNKSLRKMYDFAYHFLYT